MTYSANYTLFNAGKIVAGLNSIETIAAEVAECGANKVLIVTDKGVWDAGLVEKPRQLLAAAGVKVEIVNDTPPEPEVEQVDAIFDRVKNLGCELIIGIGGGSAMDVAKLVAVMFTNGLSLRQMLAKAPIKKRGLPTIMVPTTAGTGSEVTPNAIVLVPEEELKVGIVSSKMMPDCVILDPLMTVKLPPAITASTGMDALTHAIECYTSKKANPFSDTFALKAVSLISGSIRRAYNDGGDVDARHDMLLGAMFGGLCIATSSTTAVHALAYPLGGKYRMPHGLSNAILLPHVMNFNMDAAAEKFRDIAAAMGIDVAGLTARQAAEKMVANLFSLLKDLNIDSSLKDRGITDSELDLMVEGAAKVTRLLDNNPKPMTKDDMRAIYRKLL
ncbi:MAG TPA: iron-containing alcohol dehydrogenase [Negativicutes bacterium]|nr:iron-containing alcohol dehydrogenase [Negativicutes bacterium]